MKRKKPFLLLELLLAFLLTAILLNSTFLEPLRLVKKELRSMEAIEALRLLQEKMPQLYQEWTKERNSVSQVTVKNVEVWIFLEGRNPKKFRWVCTPIYQQHRTLTYPPEPLTFASLIEVEFHSPDISSSIIQPFSSSFLI